MQHRSFPSSSHRCRARHSPTQTCQGGKRGTRRTAKKKGTNIGVVVVGASVTVRVPHALGAHAANGLSGTGSLCTYWPSYCFFAIASFLSFPRCCISFLEFKLDVVRSGFSRRTYLLLPKWLIRFLHSVRPPLAPCVLSVHPLPFFLHHSSCFPYGSLMTFCPSSLL